METKKEGLFSNVWTVPNLLSFIRILLIPVFAVLFYKGQLVWAVVVLALSGLSDFFDGKIARRFNQISELGKLLDPVADKLTQATIAVMLFLTFYNAQNRTLHLFAWVFLLFIIKELVMLIGGAIMLLVGIRPGAAEIYGKAATMVFYLVMICIMAFGPEVGAFRNEAGAVVQLFTLPETLMMVLVVIAVIMTFVAFCSYMPALRRQAKERFSPEGKAKFKAEKEEKAAKKKSK
ncbi:MAG: CDP-alcohol phosphatidyltransferase family protein [Oscillospiraceae bacterium]|nr:CDP-alcohol phosphatidyltransferase family protein [Oscillospiraceae bacterium]